MRDRHGPEFHGPEHHHPEHDGPITRFVDRLGARRTYKDQMYVRGDARMVNRAAVFSGVRFLLVMVSVFLAGRDVAPGAWLWVTVLAFFAVFGIRETLIRAMCYRNGWMTGRQEFRASMVEAERRELPTEEWMAGELERELRVIW